MEGSTGSDQFAAAARSRVDGDGLVAARARGDNIDPAADQLLESSHVADSPLGQVLEPGRAGRGAIPAGMLLVYGPAALEGRRAAGQIAHHLAVQLVGRTDLQGVEPVQDVEPGPAPMRCTR